VVKEVPAKFKLASKTKKDDLTLIGGIGPKFATLLNQAGINTFKQLAVADINDLKNLLKNAGPMFKSLNPILWKQEAALIMKGKTVKSN
jgi:nucleotidyltransferase/DNA polymerase involved in DNA repair